MQQPSITLTVQKGPQRGQRFSVAKDSIILGRVRGSDVVISDPEVSRRHASITWERGQPVIRDLGSTNGTFVNGVRITGPQALRDGDTIGLGKVQLGFQCPAVAGAYPTVAGPAPRPPAYAPPPPAPPAEARRGPGGLSWMALGLFGLAVVILLVVAAVGSYLYTRRGEKAAGVPTVVINSPASGSQVPVGQEVIVQATATDSRGVTRVELLVNGVLYHSDVSPNPQGQSPFIYRHSWRASAPGNYTLMLRADNAAGGVSQPEAITVNVIGAATPTPGEPTATPTLGQPTATPTMTSTPVPSTPTATWTPVIIVVTETPTPTPTGCILDAAFVADVTVPDGTVFEPGARIDKIWRIRNSGGCPWESGSTWVFVSGDQMGAAPSQAVPTTAVGGNVDIGVTMYAPSTPGTYTGYWRMKSPDGQVFGQTSSVRIVVLSPATATPTSPPPPGAEISLTVDRDHINAGECTWVRARVEYVRAAYLDGEPVIGGRKEKEVCPCNDTTYTLHVELTDGSTTDRTVTVHVAGVCPSPAIYDLYVRRMDFTPSNPAVIDTISLVVMIATDTYPSGGPFFPASHFRWRQGPGFDWQEESCPANTQYASCTKTVTFKYPSIGYYDVEVQADNRNEVAETNEGNNVKVWTLTISP
ncbi:MAG: NBR1-Ig-like domain-containing protein [Anaerolineae bacterium]|nr:NBR1-Ig-like domain-containing protein [Anaerolineae bacterium]